MQPIDEEDFLRHDPEYDNFRSYINFENLKTKVKKNDIHGLNEYIRSQFDVWTTKKLIVGVLGEAGNGKSSLINTLRGVQPREQGAAPVGTTETTAFGKSYPYPGNESIKLVDYPGVGTLTFPKEKYLKDTNFLESSVVIIVSCTRFTEIDVWLAKEVISAKKNVIFVHTKVDHDIEDMKNDDVENYSEYTCMGKIKTDINKNLTEAKLDKHILSDAIFLVSTRFESRSKYDFSALERKLKNLPIMKVEAICHHLFTEMKDIIAKKTANVKTDFLGRKVASVVTGFLPVPKLESTLEEKHVMKMITECQLKYCLDKDSIAHIAEEIGISRESITRTLKSYDNELADGHTLYTRTEDEMWDFQERYSKYVFPFVGMLYSAYKSPYTMQECLDKVCDVMAEDELKIVRLRLRKLEKDLKERCKTSRMS